MGQLQLVASCRTCGYARTLDYRDSPCANCENARLRRELEEARATQDTAMRQRNDAVRELEERGRQMDSVLRQLGEKGRELEEAMNALAEISIKGGAKVLELERELEEAREDTERLDWLAEQDGDLCYMPTSYDEGPRWEFNNGTLLRTGITIREAIDAAREAEGTDDA